MRNCANVREIRREWVTTGCFGQKKENEKTPTCAGRVALRNPPEKSWEPRAGILDPATVPHEAGTGLQAAGTLMKAPVQVLVGSPKRSDAIVHCRGTGIVRRELSRRKPN
jgi:hypothetical protein